LKRLYTTGGRSRIGADRVDKIERILARLDEATDVQHMALPGFRLHPLKGELRGFWAISVSGNWRIIFRFESGHASDVDLVDYH
jgi:toxin HigB-1